MTNGSLQRDAATQGKAEDVGVFEPEVLDQASDVVRHLLEAQRAIDIGSVPVSLEFDRDELPGLGQQWQHLSKVGLNGSETAMKQDQRFTGPVDFVVHLKAVHRGISHLTTCIFHAGSFRRWAGIRLRDPKGWYCQRNPGDRDASDERPS